jgi:tetrapyrrole methylase family protein/MazG family protein/ATP diphosphatase
MDKSPIEKLLEIMARLRSSQGGCPWDLEQSFETIAPYTIEEAYEVAEAIERRNLADLKDELGDLLFQVVFHARLAQEMDAFDFSDVVEAICAKLVRRHPHVFGGATIADARAQSAAWEDIKEAEKPSRAGVLSDVPIGLPALTRSAKLGRRASRVGFDWPSFHGVREKIAEELGELDEAIEGGDGEAVNAEMGDVFFALVNACRHLEIDPEACVRAANHRFQQRFEWVERSVGASGKPWSDFGLDDLDALWVAAKKAGAKSDRNAG